MRNCWGAAVGLVLLGLATPAFAQFGGPPGFGGKSSPVEGQLKKIEVELKKLQEQVQVLKEEVAKIKSPGGPGKGADFSKFKGQIDEKKMAEMKKAFEAKKGDMKWFFGDKGFAKGKGPMGFGSTWMHKQHGDQKGAATAGKTAAVTDHEILLQILQELKSLRKQN